MTYLEPNIAFMHNSNLYFILLLLIGTSSTFAQSSFDFYKNRTMDGTYNDLRHVDEGKADIPFLRIGDARYDGDGWSMMPGPNPRDLSNLLCEQTQEQDNRYGLSSLVFTFLQFVDHDITATQEGHGEFAPIIVPQGDKYFDPMNSGQVMIPFTRSGYEDGTGTSSDNPREHHNLITAWMDGSVVYGSDDDRANWLRSGDCGKLKMHYSDQGALLPCNTTTGDCNEAPDDSAPHMAMDRDHSGQLRKVFVAGDVRANEQPGLTALHTVFAREHNRICDELIAQGSCDDEANYQYARKVVGGLIQSIFYNELAPILGLNVGPSNYRRNSSPELYNSFATSVYRLGHTMISETIPMMYDECGESQEQLSLAEGFFNPGLIQETGVDPILRGLSRQAQQEVDNQLVSSVRNFLFGPPGAGGLDLAALNIQRARDHGIPDYNTLREQFGLKRYTKFSQITSNPDLQEKLKEAYGSIDNIDSWLGLLAEDHASGSPFGKSIKYILSYQFKEIRRADRFYYSRDRALSRSMRYEISNTTLSDVIKRNTNIEMIEQAFYKGDCEISDIVYCDIKAKNSKYEWIQEVTVNGEENISHYDDGYSDFTDVVMSLEPGNNKNKIVLKSGYKWLPFVKIWHVWIDYDHDGRFENGELALSKISRYPVDGYLKVPGDVDVSQTRMRVIMSLFRIDDPCQDVYYGEVEDYTVSFDDHLGLKQDVAKNFTDEDEMIDLVVMPNPATDLIRVEGLNLEKPNSKYVIINSIGQEMQSGEAHELTNGVAVSHWAEGAYYLQIRNTDGESRFTGFIVQH